MSSVTPLPQLYILYFRSQRIAFKIQYFTFAHLFSHISSLFKNYSHNIIYFTFFLHKNDILLLLSIYILKCPYHSYFNCFLFAHSHLQYFYVLIIEFNKFINKYIFVREVMGHVGFNISD